MKPRIFLLLPAACFAAEPSITLPPDGVTTEIHLDGAGLSLEIDDPGNHTWRLQTSTDLRHWEDLATHRVHNGFLNVDLPAGGAVRFYQLAGRDPVAGAASVANTLSLPGTPFNYANPDLPAHLLTPLILGQDNTPAANPLTDAGATLGRVLFYDKRLSANRTVSCSSCHQAAHGFSDPNRFSTGFEGGHTSRNSMGLTNARYYLRQSFFWDERAASLEDQTLEPIRNELEMGMTLEVLTARLAAEPFYAELFSDAFGDGTIDATRISRALAQFVRSIVSGNSKYDQSVATGFSNFTAQEEQGRQIFSGPAGGCSACHGSDNFVPGAAIFNNGLENPYIDKGVGELTGLPSDEGFFKVPSLRNIELTSPYMHDGRFASLEEVVDFYNAGVVDHPNLSPQLRQPPGGPGTPIPPPPRRLNLNDGQKAALVAFLKTLTDLTVTTDPKYSDPFRYTAE